MRTWLLITVCLLAPAGCRHFRNEVVRPLPGMLPSAGMLLKTDRIPLGPRLELRRYEVFKSDVSNDFYPYNIGRGTPAGRLVSKLFVFLAGAWELLDCVEMPLAEPFNAANVSGSGERVIYKRPDVSAGEGDWPQVFSEDLRSRRLAIYHVQTGQRFLLDIFTDLDTLGKASFWRPDGQSLAFTATCVQARPFLYGLVVTDGTGQVLLDGWKMPALKGLEFIGHSPDGKRIAALRPAKARTGGSHGGVLVEVDPEAKTVREVAEIPSSLGCNFVGRYEQLVEWDKSGRCALREIEKPAAPPQLVPLLPPKRGKAGAAPH